MCGIYGFCGKPDKNTVKIFRYLGFLNEARGSHSTGFAACIKDDISLVKDATKSTSFYSVFKNIKVLKKYSQKDFCILMGHTRQATVGAVTKENAHPFKIGRIIMSHNGRIDNFTQLQHELKSKYEVDSQIIGHLLSVKDEKTAFELLKGWFTVPYLNLKQEDILNVAVSQGGSFAYAMRGNQVYYSSTMRHLEFALKDEKDFKFFEGIPNSLYRFYLMNKYMIVSTEQLTDISLIEEAVETISTSVVTVAKQLCSLNKVL